MFALLLSGVIVGACSTESAISPNDSNVSKSTTRSARIAATNPLIAPAGWSTVQSDKYVRCFKKIVTRNGSSVSDYVVVANLKQGASIAPLYTIPVPSSASTTTHSPDFKLNNVGGWWSSATSPFAVTNASFFLGTYASQVPITGRTTLPYVLKHGGIIRASGYEIRTEVNQRWISLNGTYGNTAKPVLKITLK